MKEEDFQYFVKCLIKAAKNIDTHYFRLHVAREEKPVYRERVYCYELYHQLRCTLGNDFPYKLNGEVDKAGHPIIKEHKKPDFIVHKPGNMEYNLVVIEVKSISVKDKVNDLKKDIKTLKWFLEKANYYRAIMLIYGNENNNLPDIIKKEIEKVNDKRILVIWRSEVNKEPEIIKGNELIRKSIRENVEEPLNHI